MRTAAIRGRDVGGGRGYAYAYLTWLGVEPPKKVLQSAFKRKAHNTVGTEQFVSSQISMAWHECAASLSAPTSLCKISLTTNAGVLRGSGPHKQHSAADS